MRPIIILFILFIAAEACCAASLLLEALRYRWRRRDRAIGAAPAAAVTPPVVTIQLPVCDERFVVDALIDACAAIDYPRSHLEIQVLDDSTDETTAIIARAVATHRAAGLDIVHLRRPSRAGFKAGNLEHGRTRARGDFLAVFDADCVPDRSFLHRTLPEFAAADVGLVQTSTRHRNRERSRLTRAQDPRPAGGARDSRVVFSGYFFNLFNGSSAVIRRSCLEAAGGWAGDTLTEDLDLSLRAYLTGWRCVHVDAVLTSHELPERMADFKRRTIRCNAGSAQCCKKHLLPVLGAEALGLRRKIQLLPALVCAWLSLPSLAAVALLSVPVSATAVPPTTGIWVASVVPSLFVVLSLPALASLRGGASLGAGALLYFGTAFQGACGAALGWTPARLRFSRTPKFGGAGPGPRSALASDRVRPSAATFVEGALALYFLAGVGAALYFHNPWLLPFHVFCFASCAFVFALSLADLW